MKKILLFSLLSLFIFSCSEYADDGTPGGEPGNITNPDGTKQVKKVTQQSNGSQSISLPGFPTEMQMQVNSTAVAEYALNTYNTTANATTTTTMSGFPGGGSGVELPIEMNISTAYNNNLITELTTTTTMQGQSTTNRQTFGYVNNRISQVQYFTDDQLTNTTTITYNDSNVTVNRDYTSDAVTDQTIVYNFENNLITNGAIQSNGNTNFEFTINRNGINVTEIILNNGSTNKTYTYNYDTAMNYQNIIGNEQNETRLTSEVLSTINLGLMEEESVALDFFGIEANLRGITNLGQNNVTQITTDGNDIVSRTYQYDGDNYPTSISETSSTDGSFDLQAMLQSMSQQLIAQFVEAGLPQAQAETMVNTLIQTLGNSDSQSTVTTQVAIEYY